MMKRPLVVAAVLALAGAHLIVVAPPAHAHGCTGISVAYEGCQKKHQPWTSVRPAPAISWGVFTGTIRADIAGDFGSTTTLECTVYAGTGECRTTRQEPLQCCVEPWSLACLAVGIGMWTCDHIDR